MTKIILTLFLFSASFLLPQSDSTKISLDLNYPRWLKLGDVRTDQTSGITFIKSEGRTKYFFVADDIGAIYLLEIKDSLISGITKINFSDSVNQFLSTFPKKDFEEIVFDKVDSTFYLSIEGNGSEFNKYVGIYIIGFAKNIFPFSTINSLEKIKFVPEDLFYKYTNYNIGYEGFAADSNYFYLGLESLTGNKMFDDSTFIFIANKLDKKIFKTISTKALGIFSVCGLFSDKNYSLWGVDRNGRKIFHILFDEEFGIKFFSKYDFKTVIPNYKKLNYTAALESITMDDENNLYLIDDPFKEVFIPAKEVLDSLDDETVKNFINYVPVIFKYNLKTNKE
jgi:hypothetical protein